MKTFQDKMNEIEVSSYEECVWYLKHLDRCKMCDAHGINLPCHCKENMDDFCTWLIKFFKSSPADGEEIKVEDEELAKKYMASNDADESELYKLIMSALS